MKPYERRAKNAYPYFKLAKYNSRTLCFVDGRTAYFSREAARAAAEKQGPGIYRISDITANGTRIDLIPFEIK